VVPPTAYYERVQQICRQYKVLLIVNEASTALGRTGKMFAYQHYSLRPDMVTLALGAGSADAISYTVASEVTAARSHSKTARSVFRMQAHVRTCERWEGAPSEQGGTRGHGELT